jgi:DNA-binding GntR family transcriptional regulator
VSETVANLSGTLDLVQSLLVSDEPASSLAESAYRELRARIISLQLRPGEPLTENGLQATLGLGRTPIREALSRLVAERLVVIRPRRGVFVSEISLPDLGGVYEVRIHLEGLAGRLAAIRTADGDPQLRAWTEQLDALEAADLGYGELLAVDYRMHQTVYALSRNLYLQRDLTGYLNLSVRLILAVSERGSLPIEELSHTVADFRELFEAIRSHDADAADALARAHVDSSETLVRGRA